jgi:hypothetical protein
VSTTGDDLEHDAAEVNDERVGLRQRLLDGQDYWQRFSTILIVGGCTVALLVTLHPSLILRNNTPTGGDMGAHVWAPAYLRDHLLTQFKLTGWSMDWYSGLPVYRFYMVVPALAILLLDLVLPYGIAMKLIAVVGILALPWCAWKLGRMTRLAYPLPELLALGATLFLYDESFTIYGGNIASTMAGEFSFSIALALALLAFAYFAEGLRSGKYFVTAAVLVALSALSHGIVLLFVFGGVVLMVPIWALRSSLPFAGKVVALATLLSAFWVVPFVFNHAYMTDMKYEPRPSGVSDSFWQMFFPLHIAFDIVITTFAVIGFLAYARRRVRIVQWMGIYCVVLAIGVFVARNSLPVIGLLWNPRLLPFLYLLRYFLFVLGAYEVIAFAVRITSIERGLKRAVAAPAEDIDADVIVVPRVRDSFVFNLATLAALALCVTSVLAFRFQEMPFGKIVAAADGSTKYVWGPFSTKSSNDGFVDGWARWNFTGYEGKSAYGEYHDVVQTMKRLGEDPAHGCGRALWENNGELNKYGTTMSLMLLPFWTDSCIGSMEGLFFEAAGTTPYHFISAAALSKQSSNPVRELRYNNNDAARGARYLRELGVKYYMAFTPEAVNAASTIPEQLVEVARSGPWVIYEVPGSDIVVPLSVQPVVANVSSDNPRERWLEIGTSWFQQPEEWNVAVTDDGPPQWQRITPVVDLTRRQGEPGSSGRLVDIVTPSEPIAPVNLEPATASNVKVGNDTVSFTVDRIGVPVLVRVSYFPNWKVNGALGPYRVAPNMMVVVPTSNDVSMSFGWSMRDAIAYLLTLAAIGWIVVERRRSPRRSD